MDGLASFLLRRTGARLETVRRAAFDDPLLTDLFRMATTLTEESWESFRLHAHANDLVYVFRDTKSGAVVGFQFWRSASLPQGRDRLIHGGKLRVQPSHRRHGLHLLGALLFYLDCKRRHPAARFYRLSVASLFGFVSITESLAWYRFFDPADPSDAGRALAAAFADFADRSGFRIEPDGLIFTGIGLPAETMAQFAPAYFERPSTRAYLARNPDYLTNRCFVAFWFRFDWRNVLALARGVWRKTRRRRE